MNAQPKRIAIGGSAANPPHRAHRAIVRALIASGRFDEVVWIVSGSRIDKRGLVDARHRVAMTEATFRDIQASHQGRTVFTLDTTGAFLGNKPTITWIEEYEKKYPDAEIVWFTGADVFAPREIYNGRHEVESIWYQGERLLQKHFLVIHRPGYPHPSSVELPQHFEFFEVEDLPSGASSEIRDRIKYGEPFEHLVLPEVADYIKHHNLYDYGGVP